MGFPENSKNNFCKNLSVKDEKIVIQSFYSLEKPFY